MRTTLQWVNNVHFTAEADSGHTVMIDGPPDSGGENRGSRPMELMLMGVGGCTSFDVINILAKGRQKVTQCVTQVTADRAEQVPQVFTKIHIHFVFAGENLDAQRIERAIQLTAEKYCSASIMMQRAGVDVSHSYEISNQV